MPQLDISTFLPQLFWLLISFGLLYLLLSKFCLPQLSMIFEKRETKISEALKKAHQAKDEAARLKAEYEAILAHAAQAKTAILAKAMIDLAKMMDSKVAEYDSELAILIQNSEKKMKNFEIKSETEIDKIARDAASIILTNLQGGSPDEDLIMETLKKVKTEGCYAV